MDIVNLFNNFGGGNAFANLDAAPPSDDTLSGGDPAYHAPRHQETGLKGATDMYRNFGVLILGFAVSALALAVPASAHHSWTAEYDAQKPIKISGVVSKVEWTNPHTHFYVDVADASGKVTTWNFEMASTPALERAGWSRKTLPVGTMVTVEGFAGRSVAERAIVTSFKGPDGKDFFVPKLGN